MDDSLELAFDTPAAFSAWLAANHQTEAVLWLRIYKKGSGRRTISWEEAVIEALCWGWIDGQKQALDQHAYLQRFTQRRPGSPWSRRNKAHAERLMAEGRMQPPGLAQVQAAKADGRWDAAYAPPSEMQVPDDFLAALKSRPEAQAFFDTLNKHNRYAIAYRLQSAKKAETRQKRFEQFLAMLERGEKLH
ncbi:YdeI/OmpD-associated family protein [Gallaecimonas kandeliae]|uniref:YdeI/OmpD-associated family protein n=1 Tax=Gallaecimonas kandeliae TaxID=3029055 RepID=UPI00300FA392